jgi:hypothetical protein
LVLPVISYSLIICVLIVLDEEIQIVASMKMKILTALFEPLLPPNASFPGSRVEHVFFVCDGLRTSLGIREDNKRD